MRGHIHKRQWKGRGGKVQTLWYAVVDVGADDGGKRKQKWHGGFKTRREAEQALTDIVQSLEKQTYVPPQRLTLAEFFRHEWVPMMQTQVKASTFDSYRRNLENHVLPVLGGVPLQQLSPGHLNNLYRDLLGRGRRNGPGGGLSAKTVRNIHGALSKLLTDAADRGLVSRNVATTARPPKPRKTAAKQIQFWTPEELARFLAFVRADRLYALWHVAAMTGMRRGELVGLRWKDVDLDTRRISVRQALVSVAYELTVTTPKSHNERVIDIDPETVEVLRHHRECQEKELAAASTRLRPDMLIFGKADGTIIHPDIVTQMFDKRVARSGIRRIRLHDLRHTHATIGLRAGVPVKVMSERLGHSTPAFTLQQYAHVIPGMQAEAAEAIARLVAQPTDDVDEGSEWNEDDDEQEEDDDGT
jgi:integrase